MIVGVTGSRFGWTEEQKRSFEIAIKRWKPTVFVHGDCVGVDEEAHRVIRSLSPKAKIHIRPGDIGTFRANCVGDVMYPPKNPLDRNRDIVDQVKLLCAIPKSMYEEIRSGTWATVRYARMVERIRWIIWPDGSVTMEGENAKKMAGVINR